MQKIGKVTPDAAGSQVLSALISDVQRFSIHDGPGIRTTVFFKGCPLRCVWCQNPESLRPHAEIAFDAERCARTGACREVCPRAAIHAGSLGVDRERCDACGVCVDACDLGALTLQGRRVTLDELLDEVKRDTAYYRSSGGGVTLSGGEPTMQMAFVGAFARRCREADITLTLQTSGAFKWESLEPHLRLFDLFHFDLKVIDSVRHRELVGADNDAIRDNARRLVAANAPVLFRTPIVPGLTDTDENLDAIASFLRELGVEEIELLAHHAMGEVKLARLGFPIEPLGLTRAARGVDPLERARGVMRDRGVEVRA